LGQHLAHRLPARRLGPFWAIGDREEHRRLPLSYMRTIFFTSSLPPSIQLSASLLLILVPLVVIELGLVVFSLVDLFKPERRVVGNNKLVWALVIVLVGTIGPIAYLLAGRKQS
jgi:Phospholipase_D-nuclease N-terminal